MNPNIFHRFRFLVILKKSLKLLYEVAIINWKFLLV